MTKIKTPEKRGPGRPGLYADAAARQRAYRQRRKRAGKPTDTRQDVITSLRDELDRLRASHAGLQAVQQELRQREDAVSEREAVLARAKPANNQKLRDIEYKVAALEHELQQWKFKKSDKLRELLDKQFILRDRDLATVFLVDFKGGPIERGYEFERATKLALDFGRKAASASSAIADLVGTLDRKSQINADEKAILDAAQRILGNLHLKSTRIKESAKAHSERVKREEAEREKAATSAVAIAFPDLAADVMLLIHFLGDAHNYDAEKLRRMRPETVTKWDIDNHTEQLERDVGRSRYAEKNGNIR